MKTPAKVITAFLRLKEFLPIHAYFFLLFGYNTRAIGSGAVLALVGAINTSPIPKLGLRQLITALSMEHSPKGHLSASRQIVADWQEDLANGKCPHCRACLEKPACRRFS